MQEKACPGRFLDRWKRSRQKGRVQTCLRAAEGCALLLGSLCIVRLYQGAVWIQVLMHTSTEHAFNLTLTGICNAGIGCGTASTDD